MDDVDRANDQAQQILDMQLLVRRPTLPAKGTCHYCDEILPVVGQLFCDMQCSGHYDNEQKLRGRNGRSD